MAETSINGIEFQINGATGKAANSLQRLTNALGGLKSQLATTSTGKLTKDLESVSKASKKAQTTFGKLGRSIGRIAFYRAIRAAIRYVTDGFKEGLENAYQFSKIVGYDLAGTMDNLSTQSLKMKNQLGAAFGGLIMAVEPILLQIIGLITKAADALSQFTALLAGKSTYLKAVDTMKEYGEAVGGVGQSAKEAMKYLAPFDELNRLPGDNGSSGGSGGSKTPDYSAMFKETEITANGLLDVIANAFNEVGDWFEGQDWKDIGNKAWETLSSVFSDESQANEVVRALFRTLGSAAGAVVGFTWGFIKGAVESIYKQFKESIQDYNGDGKIGITDILKGIWNFAISPLVWIDENIVKPFWRGFTGALFGAEKEPLTVNDVLGWIFENLSDQAIIGWVRDKAIPWFKEGMQDFATDASLALTGMTPPDLKKWLTDGWKDFKTELYNIFIKPIVDVWDEFISNHPKIAKILGLSQSGGSIFQNNGETFKFNIEGQSTASELNSSGRETVINATANVTGMTDNVPQRKKILGDVAAKLTSLNDGVPIGKKIVNGVKALFTTTQDKTTAVQKTLPVNAKYTSSTDALTAAQKTLSSTANYKTSKDGLTAAQKTLPINANFNARTDSLSSANKTFNTTANFNARSDGLTTALKTFLTVANFTSSKTGWSSNPALSAIASFISAKAGWSSNPTMSAIANFVSSKTGWRYNPSLSATANFVSFLDNIDTTFGSVANFIDWYNNIGYQPEIECTARILDYETNNPGYVMGGYAKGGAFYGGRWHDIPQAASGGKFHGTMFWAGENGPEVVGHAGGRTEVLNRSQLAATMYSAVSSALSGIQMRVTGMGAAPTGGDESMSEELMYRAMLRALNDSDVFPEELDLDGEAVWRRMVQRNRQNTRMTGVNAMMTA